MAGILPVLVVNREMRVSTILDFRISSFVQRHTVGNFGRIELFQAWPTFKMNFMIPTFLYVLLGTSEGNKETNVFLYNAFKPLGSLF